ncbi:MAG: hypothetical protein AB7G28_22285 [Pirellulales bacterium]
MARNNEPRLIEHKTAAETKRRFDLHDGRLDRVHEFHYGPKRIRFVWLRKSREMTALEIGGFDGLSATPESCGEEQNETGCGYRSDASQETPGPAEAWFTPGGGYGDLRSDQTVLRRILVRRNRALAARRIELRPRQFEFAATRPAFRAAFER